MVKTTLRKDNLTEELISEVDLKGGGGIGEGVGVGTIHQLSNLPVSKIYLIVYRSIFLFSSELNAVRPYK